jgi:hypothetical protein
MSGEDRAGQDAPVVEVSRSSTMTDDDPVKPIAPSVILQVSGLPLLPASGERAAGPVVADRDLVGLRRYRRSA